MGGPIFLETSTPRDRPPSLIEVISQIQQYAAIELYGTRVPVESLLLKNQSLLIYTGLKGGVGGMALSVALLPLSLAVLETLVPVFGGGHKTLPADYYDRIWSFVMTFFWPLGYWALFVTQLAPSYYGWAPMRAISWLTTGWMAGLSIKAGLGVLLYHLGLFLLPPERVTAWLFGDSAVIWFLKPWWSLGQRLAFAQWYEQFYPLWITASGWIVVTAVGLCGTLLGALWIGHRHARKRAQLNELYEVLS